jgi:hypothetical protein
MPSVSIEQKPESRQTYLRLSGVGRLLKKPEFRITTDSNEMLGPYGWKNQDIVNRTRQTLVGSDLILEIDPRLVSYIETGRAIEISVEELGFSDRILPPPLRAFPPSNAPMHPDAIVYGLESSAHPPIDITLPPVRDTDETQPLGGVRDNDPQRRVNLDMLTKVIEEAGDHTRLVGQETEDHGEDNSGEQTVLVDDADQDRSAEPATESPPRSEAGDEDSGDVAEPAPRGRNWKALTAAVLVGLVLGFCGKYFADEYGPWPNLDSAGAITHKLAVVQADAFAPLSDDLKRLPVKSPLGVAPDALPGIGPFSGNRSPIYFNQGARKAQEGNKAEAAYWYKRALLTVDPNVLTALGDTYMSGEGVPRDTRTGYQLLRLAAGLGSEKARAYLVDRLESGSIPNAPPGMGHAFHPN